MMRNKNIFSRGFVCAAVFVMAGCLQDSPVDQARRYAQLSERSYEQSVSRYKAALSCGDTPGLHFELGMLYYQHGNYQQAVDELKTVATPAGRQRCAIAYYKLGNFTDALSLFEQEDKLDDQARYYYGLTCEKLNLFDKALQVYGQVSSPEYQGRARERLEAIEKQVTARSIKEVSPEVYELLRNAPDAAQYPQAGALILDCDERVAVTAQDTQVSTMHYVVKILNERGKEDFSETQINYDSTYETVAVDYARTIKPDGTIVDVGKRHMRDVSKYLNFPLYSNARVLIISFPEITEGASIEYKVTVRRNKLINKNDFVLPYPLQTSEPVIRAVFELSLPKGKDLVLKNINERYIPDGISLKPAVREEGAVRYYRWEFSSIPQIVPEANMPAYVEVNPTVLISSFKSWDDIYTWWWGLARDKREADDAIKTTVKELTSGLTADTDKAKALYTFCAQKIRYVAVEYGQAGFEPHKASDIFRNKYGDCKDQAVLLTTMLKAAGLPAYLVLIPTKEAIAMQKDFPAMLFNHCIAAVECGKETIFLDPTAETCAFGDLPEGDQGRTVLVVGENGYSVMETPLYPPEHNLMRHRMTILVNDDESIGAEKKVTVSGVYDQMQRYWVLYTPPQLVKEHLQQKIQDVAIGAQLESYTVKNADDLNTPVLLEYSFTGPEYLVAAGNLRILPQLAGMDTSIVAKEKRTYPVEFGIHSIQEQSFSIHLPEQLSVYYLPEALHEESPWLAYSVDYTRQGRTLVCRQVITVKNTRISQEEYPAFKGFLESVAKKIKQKIVLEQKPVKASARDKAKKK